MFQKDPAPWDTSKLVQETMVKLKLNVLEWSAKSPDLISIEMLWAVLNKKLVAKPIYSIIKLCQRLKEEWNGIGQLSCLNLIDSRLGRVQKCFQIERRLFHVELYKYILIF